MKIRIWCDSGANAHSKREDIIDLSDLCLTHEEWENLSDTEKDEIIKDIAFQRQAERQPREQTMTPENTETVELPSPVAVRSSDLLGFPPVLDACCGGRMFWYRKDNPAALFMDCREVEKGAFANNWNPNWCVKPDVIADFRDMPFPDDTFRLVVYDPPHLTSGSMKSVINKKYGLLNRDTWRQDIVDGFNECWRVLAPHGVLIFKWNDANIKATELIKSFPVEPLFGDFTGKTGKTVWMTFLKPNN